MNIAIVLAGGTGTRLGADVPKQYIMVEDRPIIAYTMEKLQNHPTIDSIIVVAAEEWWDYIKEWINREGITKFCSFASAGKSRQHSIYSGLQCARELNAKDEDIVIVHDAARPCVSDEILSNCVSIIQGDVEGAMPVISVKDTVYFSKDGKKIDSLLNRDELYAGQAPESFLFGKYYQIHKQMMDVELAEVRGSSEIAYRKGMNIRLFEGDEKNYKITTKGDLEKFVLQVKMKDS